MTELIIHEPFFKHKTERFLNILDWQCNVLKLSKSLCAAISQTEEASHTCLNCLRNLLVSIMNSMKGIIGYPDSILTVVLAVSKHNEVFGMRLLSRAIPFQTLPVQQCSPFGVFKRAWREFVPHCVTCGWNTKFILLRFYDTKRRIISWVASYSSVV